MRLSIPTNVVKTIILLFLYVLGFIFFECTHKESESIHKVSVESIGSSVSADSVFGKKQILHLHSDVQNNAALFSTISRLFIREDRLYIFDNKIQKIVIFDTTGRFIHSFNVYGRGALESLQISDFYVENTNALYLYSEAPAKIMKTDSLGNVLKEYFLDKCFLDFTVVNASSNSFIFTNIPSSDNYISYVISDSVVWNSVPNNLSSNNEYVPGHFITTGDICLISKRFENTIYAYYNGSIIEQ